MTALQRLARLFGDSPTYGRDRVNLISGGTIGSTALVLNGVVLMLVLPLMLDPDNRDFRTLTENVGFGQLLALILLGGASACATLVIPLRLITVFWGPRTGRYFDQVVLSGISPLRFVIGKVLSQNLFLLLILFLLLPWLVLSLALVTIWVSLYMNELLAAVVICAVAFVVAMLGLIPMKFQPFVLTPFPALIYPVYEAIPSSSGRIPDSFLTVFVSCAVSLTTVSCLSLIAICLGPLYGIIPENSTFGEVVRQGDSRRKRRFRLRLHIQRPSEIAFFYENRDSLLRSHEGLIRWGFGFCLLLIPMALTYGALIDSVSGRLGTGSGGQWWIYEFHVINLMVHGFAVLAAIFLFSHARNSTYQQLPFVFGRRVEVAWIDSASFLLFLLLSTAAAIAVPIVTEDAWMASTDSTLFPSILYGTRGQSMDFMRTAIEGTFVLSLAGLTVYAVHRLACLSMWLKSVSLLVVGSLYFFVICVLPLLFAILCTDLAQLRNSQLLGVNVSETLAPIVGMVSPWTVMMVLFRETGGGFPPEPSTMPFYVVHGALLISSLAASSRAGKKLRQSYLSVPETTA